MKQLFKRYIIVGLAVITVVLGVFLCNTHKSNRALREDLSISKSNEKAYVLENTGLVNKNREFQLTVDQLTHYQDTIICKLNNIRNELGIKDKNLKQLQYLLAETNKIDTIVFRDTIFKDPKVNIDTIIGDAWYTIKLNLKYPSTVITNPKFTSEKYIVTSYKKETINPPKKCFIARWFQKKHTIVEVKVVEKNPYIDNKQHKFVEIIK